MYNKIKIILVVYCDELCCTLRSDSLCFFRLADDDDDDVRFLDFFLDLDDNPNLSFSSLPALLLVSRFSESPMDDKMEATTSSSSSSSSKSGITMSRCVDTTPRRFLVFEKGFFPRPRVGFAMIFVSSKTLQ